MQLRQQFLFEILLYKIEEEIKLLIYFLFYQHHTKFRVHKTYAVNK